MSRERGQALEAALQRGVKSEKTACSHSAPVAATVIRRDEKPASGEQSARRRRTTGGFFNGGVGPLRAAQGGKTGEQVFDPRRDYSGVLMSLRPTYRDENPAVGEQGRFFSGAVGVAQGGAKAVTRSRRFMIPGATMQECSCARKNQPLANRARAGGGQRAGFFN